MKINRPRVFISHSKKDIEFVQKLYDDLRKCMIEPWLDSEEIRAGKPWLKVIFEDGIPTCDAVLVYLTVNSIESKMVKKEIDSALIENMAENGIAFLPYVDDGNIRNRLRSDIRALQCLEWKEDNYFQLLPKVVSEIWMSYCERVTHIVGLNEKNKRLELENELRSYKSSPFTDSENNEFAFILKKLEKPFEVSISPRPQYGDEPEKKPLKYLTNLLTIIIERMEKTSSGVIHYHNIIQFIRHMANLEDHLQQTDIRYSIQLFTTLLVLGLVKERIETKRITLSERTEYELTQKAFRFRFWFEFNEGEYQPYFEEATGTTEE